MKKEVFLAIAIGFALGLVITFGIWTANKSLAGIKNASPTPTASLSATATTPSPTVAVQATTALLISSPEDEAFSNKNSATVSGHASANATVVLTYENNEQVVVADASGNYTAEVILVTGYNQITATAFDSAGKSTTQTIVVTYSTAII